MRMQQLKLIIMTMWLGLWIQPAVVYANQAPAQVVATVLDEQITLAHISPDKKTLAEMARGNSVTKEMALASYRQHQLTQKIVDTVLKDYAKAQHITTNPQLVSQFVKRFAASDTRKPRTADIKKMAREQVNTWLIDKALYQQHGGVVVFTPRKPLFPVEAYQIEFRRYQQQGQLTIHDAGLKAGFWQTFEKNYDFEIPPSQVSFAKPWWLTTDIMP
ncbi:SurA N-terminal domain-containing protein [Salinimonas marina]|uniref:SurA N-terminal domain-containing protein n=1 Tax=Salinimonas marina TaxID=2785918 RepID=A0A7S9DXT9_9ALTE|nr:SurA N-terminal domain-containing protein [Salinimonas marina]QPG05982.1 SurA N-terminal domain-containing protein [Salinimonas marina]